MKSLSKGRFLAEHALKSLIFEYLCCCLTLLSFKRINLTAHCQKTILNKNQTSVQHSFQDLVCAPNPSETV